MNANYDRIRSSIEQVIPGFDRYNERVQHPGGFYLPNAVRDHRRFDTSDGLAQFTVHQIPQIDLSQDQFLMMTIRSHDQYNTTIYGLDDRYRGIKGGRRVILMNPDDVRNAGWDAGQLIDITSHFEGETRQAPKFSVVPYQIPKGCVASYFPETNVLVPVKNFAHKSHTPASKSIVVRLSPSA